ncbi:MAG: alpha/beta family hydrolase [Vicinamibacterales bacterium]
MPPTAIEIPTPDGPLPGEWFPAVSPGRVCFVFAHGAGAGHRSPFMRRHAALAAERGVPVLTFDFPYLARGRKAPDRPPVLLAAFRAAVDAAIAAGDAALSGVVVGGKSMGGRMATHLAAEPDAWTAAVPLLGAVAYGYPLRPPGGGGSDRVSHLARLAAPVLVVQGTRDPFGGPDDVRRAAAEAGTSRLTVRDVPTGDHSLKVLASAGTRQPAAEAAIADDVAAWIGALVPAAVPPAD